MVSVESTSIKVQITDELKGKYCSLPSGHTGLRFPGGLVWVENSQPTTWHLFSREPIDLFQILLKLKVVEKSVEIP